MSPPRKAYGANHPGRLPATMIKVLAAEMSDPTRLRRGKQYARDGSVLDILVEPGIVTCEIQGSRSTPYVATIRVEAGNGMPLRRDIVATCTCPDDDNWENHACKHVIAALFTLSDEFLIEPALLDLWRASGDGDVDRDVGRDVDGDVDAPPEPSTTHRHLRLVGKDERAPLEPARDLRSRRDRLAELLAVPEGEHLPEVPRLERLDTADPADRQVAAVLRDALAHLRLDWD